MWCGDCQQDVPGIVPQGEPSVICCARCNEPLKPANHPDENNASPPAEPDFQPFLLVDWRQDDDLHEISRRLQSLRRLPDWKRKATHERPSKEPLVSDEAVSPHVATKRPPLLHLAGNILLTIGLLAVVAGSACMAAHEFVGDQWSWHVGIGLLVGGNTIGMISMLLRGGLARANDPPDEPGADTSEPEASAKNAAAESYESWQLRLDTLMKQPIDRAA